MFGSNRNQDIHVSVDAQISMLEVVQLAQKHGLITDVYAAFPASLREQRVNVVNGGEYILLIPSSRWLMDMVVLSL
jgi:hypothetical protein